MPTPTSLITTVGVPVPGGTVDVLVHWHVSDELFDRLRPDDAPVETHHNDDGAYDFRSARFKVDGRAVVMYGSAGQNAARITVAATQREGA